MSMTLDALQRKSGLIGESDVIREVLQTVAQIAPTDISVLVLGESGTGKEMVAKAIHTASRRKFEPLITVNCGAIPVGIIESELFGHKKGSFTGADEARKGYFEAAHKGTIFLDEIGETPLETQVKLLRVIETGEFIPVGGTQTQKVDVRIVAATHRDLRAEIGRNNFRQDLYYRLKTVTITMPPLRDHVEDIAVLVERFGLEFATRNDLVFRSITPEAVRTLKSYRWPGNVRELKNVVESVLALNPGERITPELLATHLQLESFQSNPSLPVLVTTPPEQSDRELVLRQLLFIRQDLHDLKHIAAGQPLAASPVDPYMPSPPPPSGVPEVLIGDVSALDQRPLIEPDAIGEVTMEEVEREIIAKTLAKFNHNRRRTAQSLGIAERTLYRKIQSYGLDKK